MKKDFDRCDRCDYHLIKYSNYSECPRCSYKVSTMEYRNKISKELGFKSYDDYIKFTKNIQKYEGVTYSSLDRRTKDGKEKARFISKCGNEHLK